MIHVRDTRGRARLSPESCRASWVMNVRFNCRIARQRELVVDLDLGIVVEKQIGQTHVEAFENRRSGAFCFAVNKNVAGLAVVADVQAGSLVGVGRAASTPLARPPDGPDPAVSNSREAWPAWRGSSWSDGSPCQIGSSVLASVTAGATVVGWAPSIRLNVSANCASVTPARRGGASPG